MPVRDRSSAALECLERLLYRERFLQERDKANHPMFICGGVPGIGKSRLEVELPKLTCCEAMLRMEVAIVNSQASPILSALARERFIHVSFAIFLCCFHCHGRLTCLSMLRFLSPLIT